ncbi:hypothetical protein CPB85DRAFT_1414558 [Mucidula mucida]|nr:hypothetical protein CPB85DRAFT_1414558 [Mucidula mucida]
MAHGPCGPEFREAFSCFVHSDAEPKGINCVEKFQGMQNCFREHPDVYSQELMDDDDEEESATKPDGEDPVAAPVAPESAPVPKKKQDAPSPSS